MRALFNLPPHPKSPALKTGDAPATPIHRCGGLRTKIKQLVALKPYSWLGFIALTAVLVLAALPAYAGLGSALGGFLLWIARLFANLTVTLIGILLAVAQYNNFIDAPAVSTGWVVIRDVMNMFFIVMLLMMAFGTVFRVENYHYRHHLGKLLIMAVLVNFSKAITGFMIDVSQVVMLTFVNGFAQAAAGNFVQGLQLDKMFQFAQSATPDGSSIQNAPTEWELFTAALLGLISVIVTTVVIGVFVVVFILRIVALWFLTIISPLAYVLNVFPGRGQEYASMWWDNFVKYASAGPILAFFLWLSLSVMQITQGQGASVLTGVNPTNGEGGFSLANTTSVAITGIGSSPVLLSFIVNIILLIGALWMTQKLGVAGGKLAGAAITKMQRAGTAPLRAMRGGLKVAGKGVKALGSYAWEEASSALGVQGLKDKWVHGWKAGTEKRREARRVRMERVYGKRKERGSALQYLASPDHFFTHIWNWKTLGKTMTFKLGDVTGKTELRARKQAEEARKKKEEMGKQITDTRGETYRANLLADAKTESKKAGELGKKQKLLKVDYDEKINSKEKELSDTEKIHDEIKESADNLEINIGQLRIKADGLQLEADKLKVAGNVKDATQKQNEVNAVNKEINQKQIQLTDKRDREKKTAKKVTTASEQLNSLKDNKNRIVGNIKKEIDNSVNNYRKLQLEANRPLSELEETGQEVLENEVKGKEEEVSRLAVGGLTVAQQEKRNKQVEELNNSLKKLSEEIAAKRELLRKEGRDPAEINTLLQHNRDEYIELENKRDYLLSGPATDEERKENIETAKQLQKAAAELRAAASKPITTEGDRQYYRKEQEKYAAEEEGWQKIADQYKPATDYDIRRDQRLAINEEKSKMTTDNWKELVKVCEDAMHAGDATRAAAAYVKATEYANENEFQNSFGFDSDAKGMRKFIEEVFIKQLGMSREQALALASDVSYTGERVNHWGVARAIEVKNGKLEWVNEHERQIEVLAEVRKKDFEGFMRQANRLAYGNEVPADDFQTTGGREFKLNDFGKSFIIENATKFDDLMNKGRFNVNLAINISSGDNIRQLEEAAKKILRTEEELTKFRQTLLKIKEFAGTKEGGGQFDDIKKIMGVV